jgi:hypothetical protein
MPRLSSIALFARGNGTKTPLPFDLKPLFSRHCRLNAAMDAWFTDSI